MKIYLDTCCLNRPFDDQRQPRVRLESEAITLIMEKIRQREWEWVGSEVLIYEIEQTTNTERKERLLLFARETNQTVEISEKTLDRAETLSLLGFGEYDALHDDKNKKRLSSLIVINPVKWLEENLKHEN
jgi:hypothetical protein